jgi:hypothetical protein
MRQIWGRSDRRGDAILAEAGSRDELDQRIHTLALVKVGMVQIDAIIPLQPHAAFASS